MKRREYMTYAKTKPGTKKGSKNINHGIGNRNQYYISENYHINLKDIVAEKKKSIGVGDSLLVKISKDAEYIGTITEIFDNHVLCRSLTDNYNFSVSWINLALGLAEVI